MFRESNKVKRLATLMVIILISALSFILLAEDVIVSPETVFAEYKGGTITKGEFDQEFEKIPIMYRSRFSTLEGQESYLHSLLINKIFYLKALELGIDQQPETIQAIEDILRPYFAREFRARDISQKINISDADVRKFYEENSLRFSEQPATTIKYIMVEEEDDAKKVKEALDSNVDFIDIMNQYSVNQLSKRNQGYIRSLRGNGYIQGVGREQELDDAIKEAELMKWVGPLETEIGYHFFQVTERIPSKLKPLEDVRFEIENRLRPVKENDLKNQILADLKNKYAITINEEVLARVNIPQMRTTSPDYETVIVSSNNPQLVLKAKDIHTNLQQISSQERAQLSNPEHLMRVIDNILETKLFEFEARNKGYERYVMEDSDVEQLRRTAILRNLFQKLVTDYVAPAEEEVKEYYQDNIHNFTSREHRKIQLFVFPNRRDARRARSNVNRAMKNNNHEAIEKIIEESLYTNNKGVISNLFKESTIQVLDDGEAQKQIIWNTGVNKLSNIHQKDNGEYFFVRVLEHSPTTVTPLEHVQDNIKNSLGARLREQRWSELQDELMEEYEVVTYPDRLALSLTSRELFELAEEAQQRKRYTEAIDYYDRIIKYFKNNDDDYKALFMKAFLMAEEMNKGNEAVVLFQELVNNYPHSDLHESAEYMIKSIRDGYDIFED